MFFDTFLSEIRPLFAPICVKQLKKSEIRPINYLSLIIFPISFQQLHLIAIANEEKILVR